jgi:hypothetical protein
MTQEDQIREYAIQKGWLKSGEDVSGLKPSQYRKAAVAIRPGRQAAKDIVTAVESRVSTTLKLRVVPQEIIDRNVKICRSCPSGKYTEIRGGKPVCKTCSCNGKWLESKWKDPRQKCPEGHWSNEGHGK